MRPAPMTATILRMRSAYKFLAYAIDVLILLQAAAIAWAVFGLSKYIEDGHSISKASIEGDKTLFTEENGFAIHGISGTTLIPLVALILLIISFFAKVPEGPKWAAMVFVGVVVQIALGIFAHSLPALGFIHGFWALLLFAVAFRTARQADVAAVDTPSPAGAAVP
jgi:heme A synthase